MHVFPSNLAGSQFRAGAIPAGDRSHPPGPAAGCAGIRLKGLCLSAVGTDRAARPPIHKTCMPWWFPPSPPMGGHWAGTGHQGPLRSYECTRDTLCPPHPWMPPLARRHGRAYAEMPRGPWGHCSTCGLSAGAATDHAQRDSAFNLHGCCSAHSQCHGNQPHGTCPPQPTHPRAPAPPCCSTCQRRQPPSHQGALEGVLTSYQPACGNDPPETGDRPRGDQLLRRDGRPTPGCALEGKEHRKQPSRNLPRQLREAGCLVNVGCLPPEGPQAWGFPCKDQVPGSQTGAHFLCCSRSQVQGHTRTHTHSHVDRCTHTHTRPHVHTRTPMHNHVLMDTLTR